MQRNIVIFLIIIILFIVLALIGVGIWWLQNGFGRSGRGGASSTSGDEA
jgi:ABC-type transporter Mla subunit MlaD